MGYVMYVDGEVNTSRELTIEEQLYIKEELCFNNPIDVDEDSIYIPEEYSGLCPDHYLSEDLNMIITYGKAVGFTLNGELTLDMEMGCCGKQRWTIKESEIKITESGKDFLEDYTDEDLIAELESRGYEVSNYLGG